MLRRKVIKVGEQADIGSFVYLFQRRPYDCLNDWKDGIAVYPNGEDSQNCRSALWACLGDHFGPDKFDMPFRLPSRDASGW